MKKGLLILAMLVIMAGCSSNTDNGEDHSDEAFETDETKQAVEEKGTLIEEAQETEDSNAYVPNPQLTDDRSLQEVGQTYTDDKGSSALKAIKHINKAYEIGDIQLTVRDIKVIDHTPAYGMIDFFHSLTHDEEFDFVKVNVEIKNESNQTMQFAPIAVLELSTGEKRYFDQDIYLEDLNGLLKENETKTGNLGFILEKPLQGELEWVKITTSDLLNENQEIVSKAQEIKIDF